MKVLQALFFPPEQPGGVSSMIPNVMRKMVALDEQWDMELFSLPKRIRKKGKEMPPFLTIDLDLYKESPIIEKYLQTLQDYIWWIRMRIKGTFDLTHCHHPLVALAFSYTHPGV